MNEQTFLAALHESPNDELTWLALADWLEEDGQGERAELVRIVRRLRTLPVMRRTKQRSTLESRVAELLASGVRPVVPEVVNSIGMRLALIPPGRFRMGSPKSEKERGDDETAHEVTLTRAFYLGVFAVTQGQYVAVMGTNPSWFSRSGGGKESVKDIADEELANLPVEQVSWDDAVEFCHRLSESPGEKGLQRVYRLPSEAEWEYSCRGGPASSSPFHFGVSLSSNQANFAGKYPYGEAEQGPHLGRPCGVGSYRPNALGLYDMHGNVWEWCADWYGDYPDGPTTDPPGSPNGSYRVLRGGSWGSIGQNCRAALRVRCAPSYRSSDLGFRVAVSLVESG